MNIYDRLKSTKTLLVDDDELIRGSLGLFFRKKGCYLMEVETAEEGLKALEKEGFDIIIADYRLPGMNGLEFIKLATQIHPDVVSIVITAYGDENIASEAYGLGAHDFIQKPFSPITIIESLVPLLCKRE